MCVLNVVQVKRERGGLPEIKVQYSHPGQKSVLQIFGGIRLLSSGESWHPIYRPIVESVAHGMLSFSWRSWLMPEFEILPGCRHQTLISGKATTFLSLFSIKIYTHNHMHAHLCTLYYKERISTFFPNFLYFLTRYIYIKAT